MKWKLLVVVGTAAGGVLWAARRRTRATAAEAELWAEATDPVTG